MAPRSNKASELLDQAEMLQENVALMSDETYSAASRKMMRYQQRSSQQRRRKPPSSS